MFVLPSSTPLVPGNVRYSVTGTSGGQTSGTGDVALADAQVRFTNSGTLRVKGGDDGADSAAPPDAAVPRTSAKTTTTAEVPAVAINSVLSGSARGFGKANRPTTDAGAHLLAGLDDREAWSRAVSGARERSGLLAPGAGPPPSERYRGVGPGAQASTVVTAEQPPWLVSPCLARARVHHETPRLNLRAGR